MNNKSISVVSWESALNSFKKKKLNPEFCNLISQISKQFESSNKNYVYKVELEFGEKLIDKGVIPIEKYDIAANNFKVSNATLKKDLSYSEDPLGIVLKNHVEVYSINECINRERRINTYSGKGKYHVKGEWQYNVPLNIIDEGDLFGVFGTLDFITKNKTPSSIGLDWYVVAGNSSFLIDFPFLHSKLDKIIDDRVQDIFKQYADGSNNNDYYPGKEQIDFVKKYLPDFRTEIIYFPRHFLEMANEKYKKELHYNLLLKGWEQYSPLRHYIFENKILGDILKNTALKNESQFILQLYEYLKNLQNGKSLALTPLDPKTDKHILAEVIEKFKEEHKNYFSKSNCIMPVIYLYQKKKTSDFCLVSLSNLPILKNYKYTKLDEVIKDLKAVEAAFKKAGKAAYELITLSIEGYGNTGNKSVSSVETKGMKELHDLLINKLNLNKSQLILNGQFSSIILIKYK